MMIYIYITIWMTQCRLEIYYQCVATFVRNMKNYRMKSVLECNIYHVFIVVKHTQVFMIICFLRWTFKIHAESKCVRILTIDTCAIWYMFSFLIRSLTISTPYLNLSNCSEEQAELLISHNISRKLRKPASDRTWLVYPSAKVFTTDIQAMLYKH